MNIVRALWLWIGFAAACYGTEQATMRSFRVVSLDAAITGLRYAAKGAGHSESVRTDVGYLAGPYESPATGPVRLFRENADGKRELVAQAEIPAGMRQALIILVLGPVPGPEGETLPFGTLVYDDSLQAADRHTVRFINLSSKRAVARFAQEKPAELPPLGQHVAAYDPAMPRERADVALSIAQGKSWNLFMSQNIATPANARIWILLSPSKLEGNNISDSELAVQVIRDRRLPVVLEKVAP